MLLTENMCLMFNGVRMTKQCKTRIDSNEQSFCDRRVCAILDDTMRYASFKVNSDILLNITSEFGGNGTKDRFIYRAFVKVNVIKTLMVIQKACVTILRDIKRI